MIVPVGPTNPRLGGPRGLLAREPIDRRALLRGALRAGIVAGVPAALAGCASYLRPIPKIVVPEWPVALSGQDTLGANFLTGLPPGVASLINDRALRLGVGVVVSSQVSAADQASFLDGIIGQSASPTNFDLVVIQAIDVQDIAAHARAAMSKGIKIISYLQPLPYQTAEITVSPASLGALLADDAAAWAEAQHAVDMTALFVADATDASTTPSPMPAVQHAIHAVLARRLPAVKLTTVPTVTAAVSRLGSGRGVRMVLCSNDFDAAQVAQALRSQHPPAQHENVYVGGLGAPGVDPATLSELRRADTLRAVATVRQQDLAGALVELPTALLLHAAKPYDRNLPPILLKPHSKALADYELASAAEQTFPAPASGSVLGSAPDLSGLEEQKEAEIESRQK